MEPISGHLSALAQKLLYSEQLSHDGTETAMISEQRYSSEIAIIFFLQAYAYAFLWAVCLSLLRDFQQDKRMFMERKIQ